MSIAHKLLRTSVAMLRDNEPYRDPGIDFHTLEVHRRAPRWLAKPEQSGYLRQRWAEGAVAS